MAAALLGCAAFSQTTVDLSVIGRLDANPYFYFDGTKPEYTSGNSVLYTDLECTFGDHVALSFVGHWLNTNAEQIPFKSTPDLYRNSFKSVSNFIDYAYLDFYAGNWTFRIGKDAQAIGGFENDPWDWECDFEMMSPFWNYNQTYQWGASVAWMTPSEMSDFTFQAQSAYNVYGEICNTWQRGFGNYSFKYHGSYGPIETSNSYGWMQTDGGPDPLDGRETLVLGVLGHIGEKVSLSAEWMNRRQTSVKLASFGDFFKQSSKAMMIFRYAPSDKFEILANVGHERLGIPYEYAENWPWEDENITPFNCWFGGASLYYYPLRESKDLRVHANVSANTIIGNGLSATVGILYNHTFHIVK